MKEGHSKNDKTEMLTPMQYANEVIERDGLKLPDPYLQPMKSGKYEITHVPHKAGEVLRVINLRMTLFSGLPPKSISLPHDWTEMVIKLDGQRFSSTHPIEVFGQKFAAERGHGDILISGLGIGLVLHEIRKNKDVKTVTCIEPERELIELLSPYFPEVQFVNEDPKKYMENSHAGKKFDFVYIDAGGDSEGAFYKVAAPLRMRAMQILKSTSDRKDVVCWFEEVMRGQIIMDILRGIATKSNILDSSEGHRAFAKIDVDFFTQFGMLKPGKKTSALVVQFVRDWEMRKDQEEKAWEE
jgi:hypothetical protein